MAVEMGLETIVGGGGHVTLGWVGDHVFYAGFVGALSKQLSLAFVVRLRQLTRDAGAFHYFSDARALHAYDISARAEFLDFVLERRHQLQGCVSLTWSEGLSPASRAFAARVGDGFEVVTDGVEFEERLFSTAPLARGLIAIASAKAAESDGGARRERSGDDNAQVLDEVLRWLESSAEHQCELELAQREDDAANLEWEAILSMLRLAGFKTTRRGSTILVMLNGPAKPLH